MIGIDPDFKLHVSGRLLALNDGPMLEAIKKLDGEKIHLPSRSQDRPDCDRLAARYARFQSEAM